VIPELRRDDADHSELDDRALPESQRSAPKLLAKPMDGARVEPSAFSQ